MKIIRCLFVLFFVVSCAHGVQPSPSLQFRLYESIGRDSHIDSYRACLFLAEIPLQNENLLKAIKKKATPNNNNRLCYSYIIAKRLTYGPDYDEFIDVFPAGRKQMRLWELHAKAGYPVSFIPPFVTLLADQGFRNDRAFSKLVSALPYSDASFMEALLFIIGEHYKKRPEKVLERLKSNGISTEIINYMIAISER